MTIIGLSEAQAESPAVYSKAALKSKMKNYFSLVDSVNKDLSEADIRADSLASKYSYKFHDMGDEDLNRYIDDRKTSYAARLSLTDYLSKIYYQGYNSNAEDIDSELQNALKTLERNCNLVERVIEDCMGAHDVLVFQAIYLDERIESVKTIESGLLSQIQFALQQEEVVEVEGYRL